MGSKLRLLAAIVHQEPVGWPQRRQAVHTIVDSKWGCSSSRSASFQDHSSVGVPVDRTTTLSNAAAARWQQCSVVSCLLGGVPLFCATEQRVSPAARVPTAPLFACRILTCYTGVSPLSTAIMLRTETCSQCCHSDRSSRKLMNHIKTTVHCCIMLHTHHLATRLQEPRTSAQLPHRPPN